eukprot:scaffold7276_cov106-Isochrysis_galbana.AAC.2
MGVGWGVTQPANLVNENGRHQHRGNTLEGGGVDGGAQDCHGCRSLHVLLGRMVRHIHRHVRPGDAVGRADKPPGYNRPERLSHVGRVGDQAALGKEDLGDAAGVGRIPPRALLELLERLLARVEPDRGRGEVDGLVQRLGDPLDPGLLLGRRGGFLFRRCARGLAARARQAHGCRRRSHRQRTSQ